MKFTTFSSFPFSRELICCVLVAFSKSSSQSVQQLLVVWHEKPYFSRFSIPWTSNRATKPSWGIPRLTSVWRDSYPEKPKVRISVICFKDIRLMFETSSRKGWGWVHDGACWDRILSLWNIYIYIYIYIYIKHYLRQLATKLSEDLQLEIIELSRGAWREFLVDANKSTQSSTHKMSFQYAKS